MLISPVVGESKMWRGNRSAKTDGDGHLKLDGILPGLSYHLEDARLQEPGPDHKDWDNLIHQNVVIIPAP